ncbi:DUF4178 domain-containing protein [Iodobacter sp.]|uniref:DUF4178 domain-containing protein n=1 Tax=Iodobacter sp. TaxID=1915058 RepID=UPI0025DC501B|nr:DUF4178 domain-containing protein [Iodobacter sp.]
MYTAACPSCGAPVSFRSAASVMAVCEYCQSTLLRNADEIKDIGKMSSALEDYSRIQIGTSGQYQGQGFNVVGRIQLRYDAGFWNEWYLFFDDGSAAWLADASGQYMLTKSLGAAVDAPAFADIQPEMAYLYEQRSYVFSDIRTAQCVSGAGELPFTVGKGYVAKVVDARHAARFITLDYSQGAPELFVGEAVNLADLKCQLLRSDDQITESAGRLAGKNNVLDCPSCASPLKYIAGMAMQLVCPACHTEVDCAGDKAIAIGKARQLEAFHSTLQLGDTATIENKKWLLIGLMRCSEEGEVDGDWTEYLLYHASLGFMWLVESQQGWDQIEVLNQWPEMYNAAQAMLNGKKYRKLFDYNAHVTYAAGAFNWRVHVGDKTTLTDYDLNGVRLSKERSPSEVTWSKAKRISSELVGQWFAKPIAALAGGDASPSSMKSLAIMFTALLTVINLPLLIFNGFGGLWLLILALVLVWLPAR